MAMEYTKQHEPCKVDTIVANSLHENRYKMLKHYRKCNWVYVGVLTLDPRHKSNTFELTVWGKEFIEWELRTSEISDRIRKADIRSSELHVTPSIWTAKNSKLDFNLLYVREASGSNDNTEFSALKYAVSVLGKNFSSENHRSCRNTLIAESHQRF